ncbi:FMN-binding protein MioC [Testudinibacter sp. TR-2022]|uniref:FMN-binding protein MioC n=1 Tax=Testudinibacter sp. TR-2022 TaxID=2585029 RepID=UPI001117FAB3|nr:FMN-binding protein MioC [Testudinibacter sp. TR-2022]TNH00943.1 FMN-binding protein MioC [Pasteurellaceae bacterium Phil31]TNH10852.1 FMN-binding protein MioC [Testudinibacter sp. TR-2022]TNH12223.1 FMN-binding protein MioC [Testudinibacter sp. TR-2022]TNH15339.1 FMN-binding protein MioC [Testudinibacter sp. TR-2022]TNH17319.1 FMN-binding protein MioC [Testudinibacter sp. TR-2022]
MKNTICIITGSTLGNAEYLAEYCEDQLQQQGYKTALLHGPDWQAVQDYREWLIITSTHGAGELPDNLYPLFEHIENAVDQLNQLHFSVIGLGNSDYDTFCFAVDKVERILQSKQANKRCPSLKIDVLQNLDHDQQAGEWLPNLYDQLSKSYLS